MTEGIHRKKSPKETQIESIDLENVFAISALPVQGSWSLNVNESVAGSNIATANSIGGSRAFVSPPANVPLRGFQLHTCQTGFSNVMQEVLVIFQSDSPGLISDWFQMLSKRIAKCLLKKTRKLLDEILENILFQ